MDEQMNLGNSTRVAAMGARPRLRSSLTVAVVLLIGLLLVGALRRSVSAQGGATVSGVVVTQDGHPIGSARVRVQSSKNVTYTAPDGSFAVQGLSAGVTVTLSAWKQDYYCGKEESVLPPAAGVTLTLRLYQTNDNPNYQWLLPIDDDPTTGDCASCKRGVYDIWIANDAHARTATNVRFLSMYNGRDAAGLKPVAPGYAQDFPGTAGNCAACHAPGTAVDAPFSTNMNQLRAADQFGVHCDFCHKVARVYLNPATGLPYPNVPGVLSMDVRRPFPETERYQLFFGTFDDDNVPLEDTYLPLLEKSQYCAPCHQFSFWGTPIYQSFREWLESPYPGMGVECQTCHMPSDRVMTNVAPGAGGVERDPLTIHAHTMPGAGSAGLLARTMALTVTAQLSGSLLTVDVALTNVFGGHHVPTDYPGRNMILVLSVMDDQGRTLPQLGGPRVPAWGGAGSAANDYAGQPGRGYAKVLRDALTGEWPIVNYWKQAFIQSDNRIAARTTDRSSYSFDASPVHAQAIAPPASTDRVDGNQFRVQATLWFRRLFIDQARAKGWDAPDILMAQQELSLTLRPTVAAGPVRQHKASGICLPEHALLQLGFLQVGV